MGEPNFLGSLAKLDRAGELLHSLQVEIDRTLGLLGPSDAVTVGTEFDAQMREYRAWVETVDAIVLSLLGARVGEVVHDIRSALDHVAWELVRHGTKPPRTAKEARAIYFPIWDSDPQFATNAKQQLPGIGPKEMAVVEGMQPYNRLDPSLWFKFGAPLSRLRELSRHDKHQIITPVLVVPAQLPWFTWHDLRFISRIVHEGPIRLDTPFLRLFVEPNGPNPEVEMKGHFAFQIAFDDGAAVTIELQHAAGEAHKLITRLHRIHDWA
jgi:hypothetical protein